MAYFTKEMQRFLAGLKKNNNAEWFNKHRAEYDQHCKEPVRQLAADLLQELAKREPAFASFQPKDVLFRINRDIRFSPNKDPYKTHLGAWFTPGGKKSEVPGLYVHIAANECFVAGGCWELQPASLYKVRQEISYHYDEFRKLVSAPAFKKAYGNIKGEALKKAPKDFKEEAEQMPILKNKQFYYSSDLGKDAPLGKDFLKIVLKHYDIARPINAFFSRALAD
jgi:uncharacterized protein (TIGR02453 family)